MVYPDDNLEPSSYDKEIQRQREEKRRNEEKEAERIYQEKLAAEAERRQQEAERRQQEAERRQQEAERRRQEELERERQEQLERERDNHIVPPIPEYLTTTTTVRPTKRRPTPKHDAVCVLPPDPELDVGYEAGYRFGTTAESRIEFSDLKIRKGYDITLQFRTAEPDGILFYAAGAEHRDFVALYLQGGYVSTNSIAQRATSLYFHLFMLPAVPCIQLLWSSKNVVEIPIQRQSVALCSHFAATSSRHTSS